MVQEVGWHTVKVFVKSQENDSLLGCGKSDFIGLLIITISLAI